MPPSQALPPIAIERNKKIAAVGVWKVEEEEEEEEQQQQEGKKFMDFRDRARRGLTFG